MIKTCIICNKTFPVTTCQKLCSKECIRQQRIVNDRNYYKTHRKEHLNRVKKYKIKNSNAIKIQKQKYYSSSLGIYTMLKGQAIQRHINFYLTKEEFIYWYENQEKSCHYCKRTVEKIKNDTLGFNNRLTIDRKNNNIGYQINNIVLACYRCNSIKGDYFTEQEMQNIGQIIENKEKVGINQ